MKWVTYRSDHGERTGVLSGDAIYAMPPDVVDLVGRAPTVQHGGRTGSALTGRGSARRGYVGGADQPAVDPTRCFLTTCVTARKRWGGHGYLYRIPAFYFTCPSTVLGPYDDAPTAPGSAGLRIETAAVIGTSGVKT